MPANPKSAPRRRAGRFRCRLPRLPSRRARGGRPSRRGDLRKRGFGVRPRGRPSTMRRSFRESACGVGRPKRRAPPRKNGNARAPHEGHPPLSGACLGRLGRKWPRRGSRNRLGFSMPPARCRHRSRCKPTRGAICGRMLRSEMPARRARSLPWQRGRFPKELQRHEGRNPAATQILPR